MALTYLGQDEFTQVGPPQWQQSQWDLDTLIIPYDGPADGLNAFLDSLEKGSPADIDGDMFLVDWRTSTGSKRYPQVDLVYSGKRNGDLPPVKHDGTGQISSTTTQTSTLNWPVPATEPLTVNYYAKSTTVTYYSRTERVDSDFIEPVDPPTVTITDITTWHALVELPGGTLGEYLTWALGNAFIQAIVEMPPTVDEVVSGEYWRVVKRKNRVLYPYAPLS